MGQKRPPLPPPHRQKPCGLVGGVFLPHGGGAALGGQRCCVGNPRRSDRLGVSCLCHADRRGPRLLPRCGAVLCWLPRWRKPRPSCRCRPCTTHTPRRGAVPREGAARQSEGLPLVEMGAGKACPRASGLSSLSAPAWPCAGRCYRSKPLSRPRWRYSSRNCSARMRARSSRSSSLCCCASGGWFWFSGLAV